MKGNLGNAPQVGASVAVLQFGNCAHKRLGRGKTPPS